MEDLLIQETRTILSKGKYSYGQGNDEFLISKPPAAVVYTGDEQLTWESHHYRTSVHFVNADAINAGIFLKQKKNLNPVVIVPADFEGVFNGCRSLEEQLFTRTNAFLALESHVLNERLVSNTMKTKAATFLLCLKKIEGRIGQQLGKDVKSLLLKYSNMFCKLPRIPPNGAIYFPDLQVFRQSLSNVLCERSANISFIAASSPSFRKDGGNTFVLDLSDKELIRDKLITILKIALTNGHDAVVLTAFGCGYNRTPTQDVAKIIFSILLRQFNNVFRNITFAVIVDENDYLAHNPNGNLKTIENVFMYDKTSFSKKKCIIN